MPFTFSHPAAILPINKRWEKYFCFTGLFLGSMSPDFEYFLHFRPLSIIGHTFIGFFILNIPICFVLAYLFHNIVRKPLILHMPVPISSRYSKFAFKSWNLGSFREILVFIYSALFGMLTHIAWDSFTHSGGWMVKLLPILSEKINLIGYSVAAFKLLQHGSSILGAIAIIFYFYKKRDTGANEDNIPNKMKILFLALVVVIAGLLAFGILNFYFSEIGFNNVGILVVSIINCMFVGLILTSIISRLWTRKQKRNKDLLG